jgi:D-3-phosphoglycerate dehydrogenase
MMKSSTYIINLARGPVWDEKALYIALKGKKIAGAGTDVFEVEPTPRGNPLLELDNFVATPHMAAHTEEALKRMSRVAVDILRVWEGKEPIHPVNRPKHTFR